MNTMLLILLGVFVGIEVLILFLITAALFFLVNVAYKAFKKVKGNAAESELSEEDVKEAEKKEKAFNALMNFTGFERGASVENDD